MKGWGLGPNLILQQEGDTHKLELPSLVHGRQSKISRQNEGNDCSPPCTRIRTSSDGDQGQGAVLGKETQVILT